MSINPNRSTALLLLGVCGTAIILGACTEKIVARVGDQTLVRSDLQQRQKVSDIYYPDRSEDYVALAQLLKGYLHLEVLRKMEYPLDRSIMESEALRIDQNSKDKSRLDRIKQVYDDDRDAYLRTFVAIVYGERYLYNEVFSRSSNTHSAEFEKAASFLARSKKTPEDFRKFARSQNLQLRTVSLLTKSAKKPEEGAPSPWQDKPSEQVLRDLVSNLKTGDVYPDVVDWATGFQVLKLAQRQNDRLIVNIVWIPKKPFSNWFWDQAGGIPIEIHDSTLRSAFVQNVSWAKHVHLVP